MRPEKEGRPNDQGRPAKSAATPTPRRHTQAWPDASVRRLTNYREACQSVRRENARLGVKMARLIGLMQEARAEPDREVRELAECIVWSQSKWLLEGDEALGRQLSRDRLEAAARHLRAGGHERRPECLQRVSDPTDWAIWAGLRTLELRRLEALDRESGEAA